MDMDIGIIGSGHIGSTLARHLAALGHQVSIGEKGGHPRSVEASRESADIHHLHCRRTAHVQFSSPSVPAVLVWTRLR